MSIVSFDKDQHAGDFYSEFDNPMVEETRLIGSIALSLGFNDGIVHPYPLEYSVISEQPDFPNDDEAVEALTKYGYDRYAHQRDTRTLPPMLGGAPYVALRSSKSNRIQREIYDSLDTSNHLLIRGLATLTKSIMLVRQPEFGEEAFYPLYVSLDASYQLVLDALKKDGVQNPNAYDAAKFSEDAFGDATTGRRYFEDYYADRVSTVHPRSRHGVYPYAPIMHDDFYWLYKALREVYRYLILGRFEKLDPLF